MSAFQDMIRRVEFEDGEKNLALRRQLNERVRAARQLTGGFFGNRHTVVYYNPKNGKKVQKTRYEGEIFDSGDQDVPNGKGTMFYDNGYKLTGVFVGGSREGPFRCVDDGGDESEVCFYNDKFTEKKTCPELPDMDSMVIMGTIEYQPGSDPRRRSGIKHRQCRNLCFDGKDKYCKRKSPPYPANAEKCQGKAMRGNDKKMYESKPNKNGVFTWKKVKQRRVRTANASEIKTIEHILRAIDEDEDSEVKRDILENEPVLMEDPRVALKLRQIKRDKSIYLTVGDVQSVLDGAEILVVEPKSLKVSTLTEDHEILQLFSDFDQLGGFSYKEYDDFGEPQNDDEIVGLDGSGVWMKANKDLLKFLQQFMAIEFPRKPSQI